MMHTRSERKQTGKLKPLWITMGAIGVAMILCVLLMVIMWVAPDASSDRYPTAVIVVIPAPTYTPTLPPSPSQVVGGEEESPETSRVGADISLGAFVEISGTQGDGLRLRSTPGLDGEIQFLAYESEVFRVDDGPKEADGYIWWFLVAPYDESVRGWAAENYLTVVQNP
jgi:hypothetical protein